MGLAMHIDVDGAVAAEQRLLGISLRAKHTRPLLSVFAGQLRRRVEQQFIDGQSEWEPLAESTVARKASMGLDPRILIATDQLRRSFTEDGGDHVEHITDDELVFGSSDPKAPWHQRGTARMPARPILELNQGDIRGFAKATQAYLIGLEGGLGQQIAVGLR